MGLLNKTLKEYPAELSLASLICLMGTVEGGMVGAVMERRRSAWAIGFGLRLLAAAYAEYREKKGKRGAEGYKFQGFSATSLGAKMEKYEVVKDIGSGNFGVAKIVKDKRTGGAKRLMSM